MSEKATSDDEVRNTVMGMPGPQGVLMRLAYFWPGHNLGTWMFGEAQRKTPMPDTAEALANYVSSVMDAFACNTSDRKAALFGEIGLVTMVSAVLKKRLAEEAKRTTGQGIILPGLGKPH